MCGIVNENASKLILVLTSIQWQEDDNTRETGLGTYRNSVCYLCNFSINLTLLQNETFVLKNYMHMHLLGPRKSM